MVSLKNSLLFVGLSLVSIQSAIAELPTHKTCNNPGEIALTFDDGPDLTNTEKVLDILKRENIKATFFVNGRNCVDVRNNVKAQNLIKREFEEGHVIGSHTYSHPVAGITKFTEQELIDEMEPLNQLLNDIIGVRPAFFRPPLGEFTPENGVVLEKLGFTANIRWNMDAQDWNVKRNSTEFYLTKLKQSNPATDSFIALNHDINKLTATSILDDVIPYMKELGYKFVTVDKCIGLEPYQGMTRDIPVEQEQPMVDGSSIVPANEGDLSNLTSGATTNKVLSFISVIVLISLTIFNL